MFVLARDLLKSRRILVAGICAGLLFVSIGYLAMYPSFEDQLQAFSDDLPDAYKAFIGDADIASAEGYIRSQVYSLIAPLLIAGAAIAAGSSLARAERDQTLAVLALTPVSRRRLFGSWWLLVLSVVNAGTVSAFLGVSIGGPLAGASVGADRVLLATLPMMFFGLLLGGVALLVSTWTGAPSLATGVGWLTILAAFIANSFAELVDSMSWLAVISPWAWHGAGEAITSDFDMSGFVALVVSSLVVAGVALVSFERRNLHL